MCVAHPKNDATFQTAVIELDGSLKSSRTWSNSLIDSKTAYGIYVFGLVILSKAFIN